MRITTGIAVRGQGDTNLTETIFKYIIERFITKSVEGWSIGHFIH